MSAVYPGIPGQVEQCGDFPAKSSSKTFRVFHTLVAAEFHRAEARQNRMPVVARWLGK